MRQIHTPTITVWATRNTGVPKNRASGSIIIHNYEPVRFSIEGAGLLVGANPTQIMAGQRIILVQSSFEPGKITVSAEVPGMVDSLFDSSRRDCSH